MEHTNTLEFAVDFSNIESADDGDTTRYGGCWTFNGVEKRGYGDDRGDNHVWDTVALIIEACKARWPSMDGDRLNEELFDLVESLCDGIIVVDESCAVSVKTGEENDL